MKTLEEFREFYNKILLINLERFEKIRKYILISGITIGLIILLTVILYLFVLSKVKFMLYYKNFFNFAFLTFFILSFFLFIFYKLYFIKSFKNTIIKKIVVFLDESFTYTENCYIDLPLFLSCNLLLTQPNSYSGGNLVSGRIGATNFEFSDIHAAFETRDKMYPLFDGIFFVADFNKNFDGSTQVIPDREEKFLGNLANIMQSFDIEYGELVKLEDPEFEKQFVVYGDNQITSRYILSTDLMRRILEFKNKIGVDIYLSFVNSNIFIAIPCSNDLFKPGILRKLTNFDRIEKYFLFLQLFMGIVEDLNLNTRIWGKE